MGRGPNKALHLLILGFLDREVSHPYGVVSALRGVAAERWANLNPSAVYYTFERLEEDGLVRAVEVNRERRRPERTVYEITAAGRARMLELLQERFVEQLPIHPPIYPALLYADRLPSETLMEALAERIGMISAVNEMLEGTLDRYQGRFGEPLRELLRHALALNRAEIEWCRRFRESVRNGDFHRES